jgi:hypothetical protein
MPGRLLNKKRLGVICSEDEKDSRVTLEKEAEALDSLLSSTSESFFLSRLLIVSCKSDILIKMR